MRSRGFCVLLGPSGTGKSTLVKIVLRHVAFVHRVTCVTTRAPRPGERSGEQFRFLDQHEFNRLRRAGALAAWNATNGDALYGVEHSSLGGVPQDRLGIFEADDVCLRQLLPHYPLTSILVAPPSLQEAERRLRVRGFYTDSEVHRRMRTGARILARRHDYDYVVTNAELDAAVERLAALLHRQYSALLPASHAVDRVEEEGGGLRAVDDPMVKRAGHQTDLAHRDPPVHHDWSG